MVKVDIAIEIKEDKTVRVEMDLLKREDWKEDEWQLAEILQETYIGIINLLEKSGLAKETFRKIIKEK